MLESSKNGSVVLLSSRLCLESQTRLLTHVSRSSAQLSYRDAASVIAGNPLPDVPIGEGHDAASISNDINVLFVSPLFFAL